MQTEIKKQISEKQWLADFKQLLANYPIVVKQEDKPLIHEPKPRTKPVNPMAAVLAGLNL